MRCTVKRISTMLRSLLLGSPCFLWREEELLQRGPGPVAQHRLTLVSSPSGCSRVGGEIVKTPPKGRRAHCDSCLRVTHLTAIRSACIITPTVENGKDKPPFRPNCCHQRQNSPRYANELHWKSQTGRGRQQKAQAPKQKTHIGKSVCTDCSHFLTHSFAF